MEQIINVFEDLSQARLTWLKKVRRLHDLRQWLTDHADELNNPIFDEIKANFREAVEEEEMAYRDFKLQITKIKNYD